jgi:antitoxin (DNA-binding transcriptional repressor) of toxin-antitoxin stability system
MTYVTVDEITRNFPAYLHRIDEGETLVLTKAGQPFAELKPMSLPMQELRPFGLAAGEFKTPADFDDPLPEDILLDFEGR